MNIIPISKDTHREWSYVGLANYAHTQKDSVAPIIMAEIGRVVNTNPIVFLENSDNDDTVGLYSLQSLTPELNLMINDKGQWLADYIPARYRSLPFVLASDTTGKIGDDKLLCFVDNFNCVAEKFDRESTKIFNDDGDMSDDMKRVFKFLQAIDQNEHQTKIALASIKKAGVLHDWTLSLKLKDGERKMTGLKKINMEKLKGLSGKALQELNKSGGLDICFASHFSLNSLENLKKLIITRSDSAETKKETSETKSLRDVTLEKQKKAQKEEMDTLVKDLLLDDEI